MNLIGVSMDLLLAALLVAALIYGVRLERRLKALRDTQGGFAAAVVALDVAAKRAETGLETLRQASESAHDELHDRILRARELKTELEGLMARAERVMASAPAAASSAPAIAAPVSGAARLADADLRRALAAEPRRASAPEPRRAPVAEPRRAPARGVDEDLFEDHS